MYEKLYLTYMCVKNKLNMKKITKFVNYNYTNGVALAIELQPTLTGRNSETWNSGLNQWTLNQFELKNGTIILKIKYC